jgi:hypothetical protein
MEGKALENGGLALPFSWTWMPLEPWRGEGERWKIAREGGVAKRKVCGVMCEL